MTEATSAASNGLQPGLASTGLHREPPSASALQHNYSNLPSVQAAASLVGSSTSFPGSTFPVANSSSTSFAGAGPPSSTSFPPSTSTFPPPSTSFAGGANSSTSFANSSAPAAPPFSPPPIPCS